MSKMFVDKKRVPISDKEGNTVYIRAKMGYGVKNQVAGRASAVSVNGKGTEVEVDVGAYQTALLVLNVVGWDGPDFVDEETGKPIPCTPENIEFADSDEPLWAEVLEEIAKRNPQGRPDPNSEAAGSSGLKAPGKRQRGGSTSK